MFDIRTHNGTITIENPVTGNHRTFQVKTQKDDANFAPGERIVSLLDGPNNETDYSPFAFVKPYGVRVWRSKRGADKKSAFEVFASMLECPDTWTARKGVKYHFEGRCRVCNRKLTTPESVESGIGPICAERM